MKRFQTSAPWGCKRDSVSKGKARVSYALLGGIRFEKM